MPFRDFKGKVEDIEQLKKFVAYQIDELAKNTNLSVKELMEIMEEVNIVKLYQATGEVLRKISYAVDLTPEQIEEVFTDHRNATLDDLVTRLHEKSSINRSKF